MFALLLATPAPAQNFDHAPFTAVLRAHAKAAGFDYRALKAERAQLDRYVASLGTVSTASFNRWPRTEQIAFLINAYNAIVLQQVINEYPIKRSVRPAALLRPANSVWQIDGFFDGLKHRVTDRDITLDQLEHEWLRPQYLEPRVHFALVCAARSCPPLRAEAYDGARLDAQLDEQARTFLNDRQRNRFNQRNAELSEIFKWFAPDFGTEQELRALLARYVDHAAARINQEHYKLGYVNYDWTLNDAPR